MSDKARCTVGFLATALLAVGCGGGDAFELGTDSSSGTLGVAEFSWEKNGIFSCLLGCNAEAPVATGATATLRVENAQTLPPFTVRSDDPTMAQVTGTSLIEVKALREGDVRVLLEENPGGRLIDEFVVTISDVHRIATGDRLLIAVNGGVEIEPSMLDARNRRLVGIGALDYAPSPSLDQGQLAVSNRCEMNLIPQYEECVRLSADDVGEGFLEIEAASGVTGAIPLELVVAEDAVTRINLKKDPSDDRIYVIASAIAGGARVYGAVCDWGLTISTGSLLLEDDDPDDDEVRIRGAGTGRVTCEIGNASSSVAVRLD